MSDGNKALVVEALQKEYKAKLYPDGGKFKLLCSDPKGSQEACLKLTSYKCEKVCCFLQKKKKKKKLWLTNLKKLVPYIIEHGFIFPSFFLDHRPTS